MSNLLKLNRRVVQKSSNQVSASCCTNNLLVQFFFFFSFLFVHISYCNWRKKPTKLDTSRRSYVQNSRKKTRPSLARFLAITKFLAWMTRTCTLLSLEARQNGNQEPRARGRVFSFLADWMQQTTIIRSHGGLPIISFADRYREIVNHRTRRGKPAWQERFLLYEDFNDNVCHGGDERERSV